MDGVIILESFEVVTAWTESFGLLGSILMGILFGLCGIIVGLLILGIVSAIFVDLLSHEHFKKLVIAMLSTFGIIGLFIGLINGGNWLPNKTAAEYETQYKVVLESDIDYKEFTNKYEVVDFENNVYTVREK